MEKIIFALVLYSSLLQAQKGIGTPTPQETFHVNGSVLITNSFNVGGSHNTKGSPGVRGRILKSNGSGAAPSWDGVSGVPNATGTVISVNGKFIVAQEIMVQMTADFTHASSSSTVEIGNLNKKIIDNENRYNGTRTSNSFTVSENGTYQVIINAQLSTKNKTNPVVGIWDNTARRWIARVNDLYIAPTNGLQTYTLLTSISMQTGRNYSFRIGSNQSNYTLKHLSSGASGSAPVTQISVKRLR